MVAEAFKQKAVEKETAIVPVRTEAPHSPYSLTELATRLKEHRHEPSGKSFAGPGPGLTFSASLAVERSRNVGPIIALHHTQETGHLHMPPTSMVPLFSYFLDRITTKK